MKTPEWPYRVDSFLDWHCVRLLLLAALALTCLAAQGQEPTPYAERIDVAITNVEVFVEDRDGKPVLGLGRNDFVLYEDGVEQEITHFASVAPAPRPPARNSDGSAAAPRSSPSAAISESDPEMGSLVVLVENKSLNPYTRDDLLDSIDRLVRAVTERGVRVMILALTGAQPPIVLAPLSSDRSVVDRGLDRLRQRASRAEGTASLVGASIDDPVSVRRKLAYIEATVEYVGGLPGRKSLLLVLETLPRVITVERQDPEQRGAASFSIDPRSSRKGEEEGARTEERETEQVELFDGTKYLRRITDSANEHNVTLYPVFGNGLLAREHRIAGAELRALPSGAEGDEEADRAPLPDRITRGGESERPAFADIRETWGSFNVLAEKTGGVTAPPTGRFEQLTGQLRRDLLHFYSLGYRSDSTATEVAIRVAVRPPGLTARARQSLTRRSGVEKARVATTSALLVGAENNLLSTDTISIEVRLKEMKRRFFRSTATLEIVIPLADLVLVEEADSWKGAISVIVAAANDEGGFTPAQDREHEIELPPMPRAKLDEGVYVYELPLRLGGGARRFAIRVLDRIGGESGLKLIELDLP